MSSGQKVILISGCSSGIGYATAIRLARAGHFVYASMRDISGKNASSKKSLESIFVSESLSGKVIEMDVSEDTSIHDAVNQVLREKGSVDVLFNNAGFAIIGAVEDFRRNEVLDQLQTDLYGPIELIRCVLPSMRSKKSGLIINMGSVAGRMGFPFTVPYVISKFALEGLTESLRPELKPFGISVTIIEAGVVKTRFYENMKRAKKSEISVYKDATSKTIEGGRHLFSQPDVTSPEDVAEKVFQAIKENGARIRYVVGRDAESLLDLMKSKKDEEFERYKMQDFTDVFK